MPPEEEKQRLSSRKGGGGVLGGRDPQERKRSTLPRTSREREGVKADSRPTEEGVEEHQVSSKGKGEDRGREKKRNFSALLSQIIHFPGRGIPSEEGDTIVQNSLLSSKKDPLPQTCKGVH